MIRGFAILAALALLVALALLAGCATPPPPQVVRLAPPATLLAEQPEPTLRGDTNEDLADLALELRAAFRLCQKHKANLRGLYPEATP